ncbi:hypothetical protein V6N13_058825 [Hibiscus sabdariffa]
MGGRSMEVNVDLSDYSRPILERSRSLFWSTQQGLASTSGILVAQREGLHEVVRWNLPPLGWYILVVNHIDALMKRDWIVQCRRIQMNDNRVADALAKLADSSQIVCVSRYRLRPWLGCFKRTWICLPYLSHN